MGLLYTIARTLFQMGLSVSIAKIARTWTRWSTCSTSRSDRRQNPDELWLQQISAKLLEAIDAMRRIEPHFDAIPHQVRPPNRS